MADPFDTPGYRYSVNRFPGDGATTTWNLSFAGMDGQYAGYISKTHVKAYTILDSTGAETPLPLPSTAFIGPTTLKIEPAIPVGTTLVVYRDTPKNAPLLDYVDGALMIEKNLDTSNQQAIYAVAEMVDRFADSLEDIQAFSLGMLDALGQVQSVSEDARDTADLALTNANTALSQATAAVQTSQDALAGVAGATQAAIDATAAANSANTAAGLATTAANNANQAATDALDTSSQALATAQTAENTANGVDAKATQALADAADAVNTANGVDAKATQALADAADAVNTANSADAKVDAALQKSANLSDLTDAPTARTNLGLGTAATLSVGTGALQIPRNQDLPAASQATSGIVRIADTSQAIAGTDASAVLTPSAVTQGQLVGRYNKSFSIAHATATTFNWLSATDLGSRGSFTLSSSGIMVPETGLWLVQVMLSLSSDVLRVFADVGPALGGATAGTFRTASEVSPASGSVGSALGSGIFNITNSAPSYRTIAASVLQQNGGSGPVDVTIHMDLVRLGPPV